MPICKTTRLACQKAHGCRIRGVVGHGLGLSFAADQEGLQDLPFIEYTKLGTIQPNKWIGPINNGKEIYGK